MGPAKGAVFYHGIGCDRCKNRGYSGRAAIIEALPVSEAIRRLIIKRASAAVIKNQAIAEGMKTLRMVGIDKAMEGITTLEEVWRVTAEAHEKMNIPFIRFFKKDRAEAGSVAVAPRPVATNEKPVSERLGKTVLPNSSRIVGLEPSGNFPLPVPASSPPPPIQSATRTIPSAGTGSHAARTPPPAQSVADRRRHPVAGLRLG